MNENLLLIAVTMAAMLWPALPGPTAVAQTLPVPQTFQELPQAQQVEISKQERLQRKWQQTVQKAYAQRAILQTWHERAARPKQASTKADGPSRTGKPLRVTKAVR